MIAEQSGLMTPASVPTSPRVSTSNRRKNFLFSIITTVLFLCSLEMLLRGGSSLWLAYHLQFDIPAHSEIGIGVLGDSVPHGFRNDPSQAYPNRMGEMFAAHGVDSVTVANLARPGNTSLEVLGNLDRLEELYRKSTTGILLLQVGHNDFPEFWGQFGPDFQGETPAGFHPPETHFWERYRLVKVARLGLRSWLEDPYPRTLRPEQREAYQHTVRYIQDWSRGKGVKLYLITYLIPGEVQSSQDEGGFAKNTTIVRRFQSDMNRLIREVSKEVDCGLIDLEALIPVPTHWDRTWFADSIHPTALLHERIARVVTDELISSGSLGSNALTRNGH